MDGMQSENSDRRILVSPARDATGGVGRASRSRCHRSRSRRSRSRCSRSRSRRSIRPSTGRLRDRERELHELRERLRTMEGAVRDERGRLEYSRSRSRADHHHRTSEKTSRTRNCSKNHVRISHVEAFQTLDPDIWTEEVSSPPRPTPKKIKVSPKTTYQDIVSTMKVDVSKLASENVSYVIFKSEDSEDTKKRREQKRAKRLDVKEVEPITGPFECLEASTIGADSNCHQMFFSCCEYSEHQLVEHTRPRRRTARCQVCERPLAQLHDNPKDFTCEVCHEGFDSVNELLDHKNVAHYQKKRFECSVCHKRFSAQGGVVQHMRMHTGDKPYTCSFCPKAFTQKSGLEQHIRTHTKVKPFECVLCRKRFIQTVHLRQHMRTHTNVAPFQCVVCDKRFKQSSHLNYHLKNHPANMTEEQKEKYHRIVDSMQRDDEETVLAERSIQEEPRVITCEIDQ